MNLTKLILSLLLVALLLTGCVAPPGGATVEPQAGQWQTWVLTASDEVRPLAPPDHTATLAEITELKMLAAQRDAAAQELVAYWDAGSPSYRWIQIALDQFKSKPISPPRNARGMSLLNVAIYDAMVAAWNAKYTYNRPRPSLVDPTVTTLIATPHSPSYPSEHAVAAGAAAAILEYLYPDDAPTFAAKAEAAARSRLLAGVQYPSDIEAGLALGRQVAHLVIERAQADRSDVPWEGTIPSEPGHWTGEEPIEPLLGTWQSWVLTAGDQFRPPPPLAYDSAEKAAELSEIKTFTRTWETNQKALYWQTDEGVHTIWYDTAHQRIFEHHLDTNPPYAAYVYAVLSVARSDAFIACWDAKYAYWAIRPFQLDPEVVTLFPTPNHPSYPAAHGCISGASAAALAALFPAEADAITALAEEAAMSRLWAGIHYRSDIETGLSLGRSVGQLVVEHAAPMVQP